eukprot:c16051_g2_i1 orf=474-1055(+)
MGITGSRVKADREWDEIGKLSEEQQRRDRNSSSEGSNLWSLCGCESNCWPQRPRNKDDSSGISATGILYSENSSIQPSGQTDISDTSLKSAEGSKSTVSLQRGEDLVLYSQLKSFSYIDLRSATKNFRPDSLLGEGGFGCVYKGWIDEHGNPAKPGTGLTVAVKTLNSSGLQGHKEWLAEVTYLGHLHHPNLV